MEWGVKPEDMVWYQERGQHFSHTGASAEAGLPLPKNVELHYATTDFNTMFLKGELDVVTGLGLRRGRAGMGGYGRGGNAGLSLGRRQTSSQEPDITTLFPDIPKEAIRFFKKTGVYQPHHTTAVRESILDEHPWVALSLMNAFEESKRLAIERLARSLPTLMVFAQHYVRDIDEVFGPDPFPYGIKANAKAIDMAQTFSVQQGLTERKQPIDELFPQEVIYSEEAQ